MPATLAVFGYAASIKWCNTNIITQCKALLSTHTLTCLFNTTCVWNHEVNYRMLFSKSPDQITQNSLSHKQTPTDGWSFSAKPLSVSVMPQPAPKVSPRSSLARSGKAAGSTRGEVVQEVKTVATTKLPPLLCQSLLSPACCFCALALIRPDLVARCLVAVVLCAWSWFRCSCQNKTVLIVWFSSTIRILQWSLFVTQQVEVQITFFCFLEFVQTCHRIVSVIPSGSCYIYDYSNNHPNYR